jgi:enamine deaminase RidA (YjgF/YER057c/UK114 family)
MRKSIVFLIFASLLADCTKDKPLNNTSMTNIIHKNPKNIFDPTPYAFCHSTNTASDGQFVFISGQSGGKGLNHALSNDFKTQVHAALLNLKTVLDDNNLNPEDVLKITVLIVDHNEDKLKIWTEEMKKIWKNQKYPASTLIPVPRLALDHMLIEVDATAFKSKKQLL